MKTLICIGLVVCLLLGVSSCSLFDEAKDQLGEIGSGLGIDLDSDKIQDLFQEGLADLETVLGKNVIEATGEAANNEAGNLHVYNDKIVITVDTEDIRAKMNETGVTVESIQKEQANAATAQMEYQLQYQYIAALKINGSAKAAVCYATVTTDTLTNTVDITIPIATGDMGVTIYELLQGGSIEIESCLQHGTDTTKSVTDTYYLNTIPEGKTGDTLTMQDHRNA